MTLCFKVQSLCGVVHFLTEHLFYLNSLIFLLKFEMCTIAKRMSKKKKTVEGHCDSIIYTFTERERKDTHVFIHFFKCAKTASLGNYGFLWTADHTG